MRGLLKPKIVTFLFLFFLILLLPEGLAQSREQSRREKTEIQEKEQKKEESRKEETKKETKAMLSEEIVVIGSTPREAPLASVTRLEARQIQSQRTTELAEILRQAPGVTVSLNGKNEFSLRLRGLDTQRLTLLVDGVPLYEPFFSSFDLKSLPASGLEAIQITTGAASALYGPSVLGGVVNLITRRPHAETFLRLQASLAEVRTSALSLEGAKLVGKIGASASINYQHSDGFYYPDGNRRLKRALSDYDRFNLNLKIMAYPGSSNELFLSAGFYRSAFGLPPALFSVRPRYWRFRDWDRDFFSLGGLHSPFPQFNFLWRLFLVKYNNSLEQYKDSSLTSLQALSTYRNDLAGLFCLGDYFPREKFRLRASLSWRQERARIQDNLKLPFQKYRHESGSLGLENELSLKSGWKLVTGMSLDRLRKADGSILIRLNPLAGVIFSPADYFSLRFSLSLKSRFPTLHSLYASQVGNPELISETGRAMEAGLIWDRWLNFRVTAFSTHFHNLIEATRQADGSRRFRNVHEARISGLEIEIKKSFTRFSLALCGQFLHHRNETEGRPLDTLPSRQINLQATFQPARTFEISLSTLAVNRSFWYDFASRQLLAIPSYENVDLILVYRRHHFELFFRVTNLLNKFFYTEPGFPWRARYFEAGFIFSL